MSEAVAQKPVADFPQQTEVHEWLSGPNFSLAHVGAAHELTRYAIHHPRMSGPSAGKVFLKQVLDLTAMEISFGLIPPHKSIPFYHKHRQNEEVYLILSGAGQFRVDDQVMPISEGTAVRVAPDGVRCCRNTSDEAMFYIVIQAKAGSLENWTGTDGVGVNEEVRWP